MHQYDSLSTAGRSFDICDGCVINSTTVITRLAGKE